jgi:hypothetical protein
MRHLNPGQRVRRPEHHQFARLQAACQQRARQTTGLGVKLGIGDAPLAIDDGDAVGKARRVRFQHRGDVGIARIHLSPPSSGHR